MGEGESPPEVVIAAKHASGEKLKQKVEEERREKAEKPEIKAVFSKEALGILTDAFEEMKRSSGRVASAAEIQTRMATGDYRLPLPSKERPELQREYVRTLLHGIEKSNRDTLDFAISSLVKGLEASLDEMDDDVAREVQARLAVYDCAVLIKQADGWIERKPEAGPGPTIGAAVVNIEGRRHSLSPGIVRLFLEEGLPELKVKVADAWDLLQDANFYYIRFVKEVNKIRERENKTREREGKEPLELFSVDDLEKTSEELASGQVPTNFYTDIVALRKDAVHQFLIREKLGGGEDAEKSFELAEELATATLENSVFNRTSVVGNDDFAEVIGFHGWRKGRAEVGRTRGPRIHEDLIPGFGVSWLRRYRLGRDDSSKPLYTRDINFKGIPEGDWKLHCTLRLVRYKLLQNLLLDRRPEPYKIDRKTLEDIVVFFNNSDKPENPGETLGPLSLRFWWLAGVVDLGLSDEKLGWDTGAFVELERAVTREELSEEAGPFLRPDQWEVLEEVTNLERRLMKLEATRGVKSALGGVVGGRSRRR